MNNEPINAEKELLRLPSWRLVAAALVGAAFVAFIVQNSTSVSVTWLFFDTTAPLWVVIVIAGVVGVILSEVVSSLLRRSRRRK